MVMAASRIGRERIGQSTAWADLREEATFIEKSSPFSAAC